MPIYHQCEARGETWHLLRIHCGPTASDFHRILTPGGRISAQAADYAHVILAQWMLGKEWETPETQWMIRGQELEDSAIAAYEFATNAETQPGGFVTDDSGNIGCSPDRIVGADGLLEIKCPAPNTHVGYLLDPASLEKDKWPQIQGQLFVTGREWVDLVSYHPELPLMVRRVWRDEKYQGLLGSGLATFVELLQLMRLKLEQQYGPFPQIVLPADRPAAPDALGVSDADVDAILAAQRGESCHDL